MFESQSKMAFYDILRKCFNFLPQRYVIAFFGFMGVVNAYTMRVVLSLTIIRMVSSEKVRRQGNDDTDVGLERYTWSQATQGYIMGSFYVGYLIMQVPGGMIAERFGGKFALGFGMLWTSVLTLITPTMISWGGSAGLICWRILIGLGEASTFPALSTLVSAWVPLKERSFLGAIIFGGGQIGTVIGMSLTGLVMHAYPLTWSPPFYMYGLGGLTWCLFFYLMCYRDPASHSFITEKEKEFLLAEMGQLSRSKDLPATPWLAIVRSVPMYALIAGQIGHDWGFYVLNSDLPKYLNDVVQVSIKDNGVYSALPYLVMWVASISFGYVCDLMIKKRCMTITNTRKFFTFVGAVVPAIFMMSASYAGTREIVVIVMFTLCMGFMGLYYPGLKVNPIDLAPNYSGTVMGVVNGLGSLSGIFAPFTRGWMTPDSTLAQWRSVFWLAFAILNVTAFVYVLFGTALTQPWNTLELKVKTNVKNETPNARTDT